MKNNNYFMRRDPSNTDSVFNAREKAASWFGSFARSSVCIVCSALVCSLALSAGIRAAETTMEADASNKHFQQLLSDSFEGAIQGDSRYFGNVRFVDDGQEQKIRFIADEMLVKSDQKGKYQLMIATGHPTQFTQQMVSGLQAYQVTAKQIKFYHHPERLVATGNVQFVQTTSAGDKVIIQCDYIEIVGHSADSQSVTAKGKPLSFTHHKPSQTGNDSIEASGNFLSFQSKSQKLQIKDNVEVTQGPKRLRAAEIFYDGKSGNVNVPKIPNQQLEITQQSTANEQEENP